MCMPGGGNRYKDLIRVVRMVSSLTEEGKALN